MSIDPNKTIKIVFACLDWRLHPQVEEYFCQNGAGADMCVTAGSVKDLIDPQTQDLFLKQIEISRNLHHCQAAVLTMHLDCGAYGGSAAFPNKETELAAAKNELAKAEAVIKQKFPDLPVEKYVIGLEKTEAGWNILPQATTL